MVLPILLLSASPTDRVELALDHELDLIARSIRLGSLRDRFEVRVSYETRSEEILPLLLETRPTVVHFSGHNTAEQGLMFQDRSGRSAPVPADLLADIFRELSHVRCVILNACATETQANAIAACVPVVIAMNSDVSDAAATAFSEIFYQALAEGHSTRAAFDLGVAQVAVVHAAAASIPVWKGSHDAAHESLASRPELRYEIARRIYETEFIALAKSISSLLDDASAGSVVEEVFGEFVIELPPVEAGQELTWIQGRVLTVAGERVAAAPPLTGEARVDRVLATLRRLPMEQSRALLYRHYHGHTDEEIAALTNSTPAAVAALIDQALAAVSHDLTSQESHER